MPKHTTIVVLVRCGPPTGLGSQACCESWDADSLPLSCDTRQIKALEAERFAKEVEAQRLEAQEEQIRRKAAYAQ